VKDIVLKRFASFLIATALAAGTLAPCNALADSKAPTPSPAVPAIASGYIAPDIAPEAPDLVGVTAQPFVGITLQDAIGMALLKNPALAVMAANARIASYQIVAAGGAFDPHFMLEPSVVHSKAAPTNAFFAGPNFGAIEQNQQKIAGGISGILPGGQQYSVGLSSSKIIDNTIVNSFNPYYPTAFSAQLTQPLLRDAGTNAPRHALDLTIVNADSTQAQALVSVSQTIAQVSNAYWDLVAAWRNVAIQEEGLSEAIAQRGSTQRLAKQGVAADIDVVESASQVAVFQDNVASALQNVALLQNALKSLVVDDAADPIWRANLVPTSPVRQLPPMPTLDALVAAAIARRPELRQVADLRKQADLNLKFATNQAKPKLDLQLGYTSNGFAGQPVTGPSPFGPSAPPPAYLVGATGQSFSNLTSNTFPTFSAGIVFQESLGEHTEKANVAIAREQQRVAAIQQADVAQRIVAEARDALQAYQSAIARLVAARTARSTSEQVYRSEVRKYRNGVSTTFLVLQREFTLAQNRGRELQAQTDLNKAVVELQRASGDILQSNNVDLKSVGQGAPSVP
jgi:HAE1 family hydrophobic/amphiphilic exporter-1